MKRKRVNTSSTFLSQLIMESFYRFSLLSMTSASRKKKKTKPFLRKVCSFSFTVDLKLTLAFVSLRLQGSDAGLSCAETFSIPCWNQTAWSFKN